MSGPVLFDLDGCLVDSTPVIAACLDHALAAVAGHAPRGAAALRWAVGPPLQHSVERLLGPDADGATVAACIAAYRERYRATAGAETQVFAGIPVLLDRLAAGGRTLAVVTSKPRVIATWLLEEVGLERRFWAIHGPEGVEGEGKAVTLRRALDDLGVAEPGTATMVGDRSHDVLAGRDVGTRTVGVTWGAGDRDELAAAGATAIVETVAELEVALRDRDAMRGAR